MKAGDIMTGRVVTVAPHASVLEAVRLMLERHISGLTVVDASGALVGMITEGDFLRRAETGTEHKRPRWLEFLLGPRRLAEEYVHSHARKVEEVMTREPITITEDTALDEVVKIMERRRIKRLPVMAGSRLVGIVSRARWRASAVPRRRRRRATSPSATSWWPNSTSKAGLRWP